MTDENFDALVVGASLAGCTVAILLARSGVKVGLWKGMRSRKATSACARISSNRLLFQCSKRWVSTTSSSKRADFATLSSCTHRLDGLDTTLATSRMDHRITDTTFVGFGWARWSAAWRRTHRA